MTAYASPFPTSNNPRFGSLGGFGKGRGARGFVMFDVMLWMGLGIAVAATALVVFLMAWGNSQVAQAQSWVQQTAQSTMSSYMSRADFTLLNQSSAVQDGLFPSAAIMGGQLVDPWGGDFAVTGTDTPLKPMGAALITMDQVPAGDCVKLAAALAVSADSISVDGTPVSSGHSTPDPSVTSTACSTLGRLQFTFNKT